MKLVKYNKNELKARYYAKTKHQDLIEEFVNSDMDCAKVEEWTHVNADSCSNAINMSIKRFKVSGVKAIVRGGEVFLVKI